MNLIDNKEFDKLSLNEKKKYLKSVVKDLSDDKAKQLYEELKKYGIFK